MAMPQCLPAFPAPPDYPLGPVVTPVTLRYAAAGGGKPPGAGAGGASGDGTG